MVNRGFDDDNVQFFHRHTLTVPLAEIEGRSEAAAADDYARAHVVIITHHRGEVALFVFQLESDVTALNEFNLKREGAWSRRLPLPPARRCTASKGRQGDRS